jgi:hypothetical protein
MMELFAKGIKDNAGMLQDTLDASLDVLPTYNVTASTSAVRAASAASGGMVVNITVNGAQYKDEETLAQIISEKIQASVARKGAVWA